MQNVATYKIQQLLLYRLDPTVVIMKIWIDIKNAKTYIFWCYFACNGRKIPIWHTF